jgi:hypothetical protein
MAFISASGARTTTFLDAGQQNSVPLLQQNSINRAGIVGCVEAFAKGPGIPREYCGLPWLSSSRRTHSAVGTWLTGCSE